MYQEPLSFQLSDSAKFQRNNPGMAKHTEKENKVGPVIERRLREMGKSQQWLADRLGLSPVSVFNWIKKGSISRDNIGLAAAALGLTTAQLLGEDEPLREATKPEPAEPGLQWLMPDEVRLLEAYRRSTEEGQRMTISFAEVAPKKANSEPPQGRRYAA